MLMSLHERRQISQSQNEARYRQSAEMLQAELESVLGELRSRQQLSFNPDERFCISDEGVEVAGHSYRAGLTVRGRNVEVADRVFDDPETGEVRSVMFIGGDRLLMEREEQRDSGPFGIMIFINSQSGEVESVQAKYFHDNSPTDMPMELIRDTAMVIRQERLDGSIEATR